MIYTKFMLTPGVEWLDGDFTPKSSPQDADEAVEREGEGTSAFALMGFDPDGERWEVLVVGYSYHGIVRKTCMMFGLDIEWDGQAPMEFDRGEGIVAYEYETHDIKRVRAWSGLMVGCLAAYATDKADWLRFEVLAKRLGVTIRKEA